MDRTNEFLTFARRVAPAAAAEVVPPATQVSPAMIAFVQESNAIHAALADAAAGLIDLQRLMRQSGIFDDRSAEIESMMQGVRQSVLSLSARIDAAEASQSRAALTPHDAAHCRQVIGTLRTRLAAMTQQVKQALEGHAQGLLNLEKRRRMYTSTFRIEQNEGATGFASPETDLESGGIMQTQQQTLRSAYHQARAEAVEGVQRLVGEMAQLFSRVATLVAAQEELTIRIEDDMGDALHSIQQGETHLLKYLQRVTSNRSLILKVFALFLAFIVFFIVFLS